MQKSKWLLAVTMAVSVLTGCKGSLCEQIADESTALVEKAKPCDNTITAGNFNKSTCEANISACTAADEKVLEQQADCVDKIKACVKGQEQVFVGALLACSGGTISQGCQDAIDKASP